MRLFIVKIHFSNLFTYITRTKFGDTKLGALKTYQYYMYFLNISIF